MSLDYNWPKNSVIHPRRQGQIVGVRESLNGCENMARRKVKNGEKSPWGQCLTRPVPNGRRRPGFWLVPENFCVFPYPVGLIKECFSIACSIYRTYCYRNQLRKPNNWKTVIHWMDVTGNGKIVKQLACLAGVETGRGQEEGKKEGEWGERVRDSLPFSPLSRFSPSPYPFRACHAGY